MKLERKIIYTPYPGLATMDKAGLPGSGYLLMIEHLLSTHKWKEACKEAAELIGHSLEGLRYLETYEFCVAS